MLKKSDKNSPLDKLKNGKRIVIFKALLGFLCVNKDIFLNNKRYMLTNVCKGLL